MNRKGVTYDVGAVYAYGGRSRPVFSPQVARRELEIIQGDLHCNAVKIGGHDLERLTAAAQFALELGLEVWLSPGLFDKSPQATLRYVADAARTAETLRQRWPGRLVFCVGGG